MRKAYVTKLVFKILLIKWLVCVKLTFLDLWTFVKIGCSYLVSIQVTIWGEINFIQSQHCITKYVYEYKIIKFNYHSDIRILIAPNTFLSKYSKVVVVKIIPYQICMSLPKVQLKENICLFWFYAVCLGQFTLTLYAVSVIEYLYPRQN